MSSQKAAQPGPRKRLCFSVQKKNFLTKRRTMTHKCWGNCLKDGIPLSWIQPKPPLQLYNGAFWKCLNSHRVAKLANKVGAGWQIYWLGHRPKQKIPLASADEKKKKRLVRGQLMLFMFCFLLFAFQATKVLLVHFISWSHLETMQRKKYLKFILGFCLSSYTKVKKDNKICGACG